MYLVIIECVSEIITSQKYVFGRKTQIWFSSLSIKYLNYDDTVNANVDRRQPLLLWVQHTYKVLNSAHEVKAII